jgi:transcriptional regulator with XRE-family HTH domain
VILDGMGQHELNAIAGANVRRLREAKGWTQDALAMQTRRAGLLWTGSVIAAVESGRRAINLDELILLALALGLPVGELLAELVRARSVEIGGVKFSHQAVEAVLEGRATVKSKEDPVQIAAGGAAEIALARELGVEPEVIAKVAVRRWGHGLTQQRDEESPAGASAKARGHVTRRLYAQIREALREQGLIEGGDQ